MAAAPDPGRWGDLTVRLASGAAMALVGLFGMVLGGVWFQMMAVFSAFKWQTARSCMTVVPTTANSLKAKSLSNWFVMPLPLAKTSDIPIKIRDFYEFHYSKRRGF